MDSRARVAVVLAWVLLLFLSPATLGEGKDLGTHGRLYEIEEENILSYIRRKAGEIDMSALHGMLEKKVETSLEKRFYVSLDVPTAEEMRVRYVDPSVTVRNPLYDHEGKIISPAGAVNPLDYVSLSKSILVLREDQIEQALSLADKGAGETILLLTDGDIRKASLLAGQPVYKATPFALRRLRIEKVPSLVQQEGKKLKVKEMVSEQ